MNMRSIGLLFSVLLFFGCTQDDNGITLIRLKNISSYDFQDVLVNTSGGENNYGTVLSKEISEYKSFDFAYSYAYVELKINGKVYTIQPIDYVGETPLKSGKYTYEINASTNGNGYSLMQRLIND